jgi:hypothetical protein
LTVDAIIHPARNLTLAQLFGQFLLASEAHRDDF